ncbi:MAG TPA: ABC transporter permease [Candidatus Limnocylindrales bacterium]|nr:ABC transporter permease [Candidatus Limnocylindrales bacterium]
MNNLKFVLRQLLKNPGFTIVVVLTLGLGIGATTAIFSVVNAVVLRPLPFPNADRLLMIQTIHQDEHGIQRFETVFDADFKQWTEQNRVFEHMAAYGTGQATLLSGGEPLRLNSSEVTIDFFSLLGVKPILGRTFLAEEHQAGSPRAVMLSESLWRDRFGANSSIVDQTITLNGQNFTVAGVLPRRFNFPPECRVWTSLVLDTRRNNSVHHALARLKSGMTREEAQTDMDAITQRIAKELPAGAPAGGVSLGSLHDQIVGGTRSLLFVFLGAVGFVLLIACANVTNLLLSRAAARQKEMQIRAALGAGRGRIVHQLLTESVLVSVMGGVLGLLFAVWSLGLLIALMPANLVPRVGEIGLDIRVLGFNFALALVTGVAFGLAPAWQASRANIGETLKESGRSQSTGVQRRWLRQVLVAGEIAVSIVLLVGAGLLLKSFVSLREVKLGFNPERVLTLNLALPNASYPTAARIKGFYEEVIDQLRALPGVRATGLANAVPLAGGGVRIYGDFSVEEKAPPENLWTSKIAVSPDYFRVLGIPLLRGRFFAETDRERTPAVGIISERLARQLWPNGNPLGKRITLGIGPTSWLEIVGVVGDVRQDDLRAEPSPGLYVPYQQVSEPFFIDSMTFVVRSAEEPRQLAAAVRKTIHAIDPTLPVFDINTIEELVSVKVAHPRFNTWLLGSFAAIALMLAIIGVYGVVSYGVSQRTHEIGIRVALGARGQDVMKMVVGQGMRAVLVGVLGGTVVAVALTRFLTAYLYSVSPTDPITFAAVIFVFIAVAAAACLIPAFRASRVDPVEALRCE